MDLERVTVRKNWSIQALIDVSAYRDDVEVPSFQRRIKCGKCCGKRVDLRPNWTGQPVMPTKLRHE